MGNIQIEIQHFTGCPNSEKVLKMVKTYISNSKHEIDFTEVLVETQEAAEKHKFRGSPTILINGEDIDGLEENKTPSLSCRYYPNGLPTEKDIKKIIISIKH